jgi:hypothetical protein
LISESLVFFSSKHTTQGVFGKMRRLHTKAVSKKEKKSVNNNLHSLGVAMNTVEDQDPNDQQQSVIFGI